MARIRVRFEGRVQGVGFRATSRDLAQAIGGIAGFVRNESDGSVLMEAQGDPATLEALVAAIRERMARNVRTVRIDTLPEVEGETGFSIAR
jgi:acylphosphatase